MISCVIFHHIIVRHPINCHMNITRLISRLVSATYSDHYLSVPGLAANTNEDASNISQNYSDNAAQMQRSPAKRSPAQNSHNDTVCSEQTTGQTPLEDLQCCEEETVHEELEEWDTRLRVENAPAALGLTADIRFPDKIVLPS